VDALQHQSVKLEEENSFWKQKADEEEHIKKGTGHTTNTPIIGLCDSL